MYDIFPKSVFTGKNADGSKFSMFEYDYGSYTNLTLLNSLYGIFIVAIVGSMVSPLLYFFGVLTYRAKFNFLFLITFIVSSYAAYDMWHDWILFKFLVVFFPHWYIAFLFKINFAVSISSLALMLTPTIIRAFDSFYVYIFVLGISFFIGYNTAAGYHNDKPDWVKLNTVRISEIDAMSSEEYIKYNNDRYERDLEERRKREKIY